MSELRADTITASDGTSPVTLTKQSAAKAWVNLNGTSTIAIRGSTGVASIFDNGTGDYTITFSNAMTDTNYAPTAASDTNNSFGVQTTNMFVSATSNSTVAPTTTAYRVSTRESTGAARDETYVLTSAHGDLA